MTYRDHFNLQEYDEWFIEKIINYRMRKDELKKRYLDYEEIAEIEGCSVEDVTKILSKTSYVWNQ